MYPPKTFSTQYLKNEGGYNEWGLGLPMMKISRFIDYSQGFLRSTKKDNENKNLKIN